MRRRHFSALTSALILCVLAPAAAQQVSQEAIESCRGYSNAAGMFMEKRQQGARMSDMVDAVMKDGPNEHTQLAQLMVREAFEEPFWQSPERKQQAVSEFSNRIYVRCFDSMKDKESSQK